MNEEQMKVIAELYAENDRLERENNQLKEQYCERTDCVGRLGNSKKVERLLQENKELHNKIAKAIEYINNSWTGGYTDTTLKYKVEEINITELLEILKGDVYE